MGWRTTLATCTLILRLRDYLYEKYRHGFRRQSNYISAALWNFNCFPLLYIYYADSSTEFRRAFPLVPPKAFRQRPVGFDFHPHRYIELYFSLFRSMECWQGKPTPTSSVAEVSRGYSLRTNCSTLQQVDQPSVQSTPPLARTNCH